ncbi:Threonine aldolase [Moorella glycerini]|uniref:L-allo-threonine aldolase n=1 Tax=Neomoorella stamsii TaxID=1266720 RepID=A0A9X7J4B3_9FIRM|nr:MULTISPECIES: low-specificity L-threonine aldolase [Moorella]PRR73964.1 L-allo-threonine aldolase [Moorella stamsii]CEP66175.1 Threonine aldolase [Moorella glycerini]
MKIIDLRSDTVTVPSEEMQAAMARAEVGDDVYGEDPTVKELEQAATDLLGKEAALFVASGTMANQIALLAHTERGNEVIVDAESHIYYYEVGAAAMLGGVQLKPLEGLLSSEGPEVLRKAFRPPDIHFPITRLVCLENTFNRGGGTVISPAISKAIYDLAKERELTVHLDGARIFNAALALGCDVREFTRFCDSVMFSLSKGLGAPVGSLLAGSQQFIEKARRYRKALGGGWRQAGVLAAAGLVALKNIPHLAEDHANARYLAEGLAEIPGLQVDLSKVVTNIVVAKVVGRWTAAEFAEELARQGVKCNAWGPDTVRFVTHKDVSRADIETTLSIVKKILRL